MSDQQFDHRTVHTATALGPVDGDEPDEELTAEDLEAEHVDGDVEEMLDPGETPDSDTDA